LNFRFSHFFNFSFSISQKCLPLLRPEWAESGRLYDFPTDRLMDFHPPA
jgi:hypothetical protein